MGQMHGRDRPDGPVRGADHHRFTKSGQEPLFDQPCFSDKGSIKAFPEYAVTYCGDKYWCDQHIKFGGGTDPRKFFRIYYYWDKDEQILLIGHLPTHLDNNLTN